MPTATHIRNNTLLDSVKPFLKFR